MIKFCSLFSGSSGNCLFVEGHNTKLLIDAGVSCKRITTALEEIEKNISEITAIIVTHEHSDHTSGVGNLSKKYNIPVYASLKTWEGMPLQLQKVSKSNIKYFSVGSQFKIGDLIIHPFSTPHDALDPCGLNIFYGEKKITIATDVGHISNQLIEYMYGSNLLFLESNHDVDLLKVGSYPYFLKRRIISDIGHLSNESAGNTIGTLAKSGVNKFILGHLSKENNFPELAYQTVCSCLTSSGVSIDDISLDIAKRDCVSQMVVV
jgi:phosphoribosyl 1,2-cyclic phosphodiesterase